MITPKLQYILFIVVVSIFFSSCRDELPVTEQPHHFDEVFNIDQLPEVRISITTDEWNKLLMYFDQNPFNEECVVANMEFSREGHTTAIRQAGFRLRGNTSRRRPEGRRGESHRPSNPDWHHASFSIDFNEFVPGQRFSGLKKLHLKWFKDDPMYVREIYCYDLFERYGVWTAPQSSYCKLYIDITDGAGEAYFGVYQLLEPVDDRYLRRRVSQFGDSGGFLWKAFWGADFASLNTSLMGLEHVTLSTTYKPPYDLKTRKSELEIAKSQLVQFINDLNQKHGEEFEVWVEEIMDIDLFLKTYAVSVICGMWDDYWNNKNNFYFYFSAEGKFFFIPYDYDNTLGTSLLMTDAGRQDILNWGKASHPLVHKILERPRYRERYLEHFIALSDEQNDLFHVEHSISRIQQWHQMIGEYIYNDTGEDLYIIDRPASWGNCPFYRLLSTENNYFIVRSTHL